MIARIKEVLAEALEIEVSDIYDDFSQEGCSSWDSIHHLTLVVDLESEFDVDFDPEEISEMTSLKKIILYLKDKN